MRMVKREANSYTRGDVSIKPICPRQEDTDNAVSFFMALATAIAVVDFSRQLVRDLIKVRALDVSEAHK